MKYLCQTLFDITATGVTGHCKLVRLPFCDQAGQQISNQIDWNRSRNQQRNWETLTQILGLRTQLFELTNPVRDRTGTRWMFEFATETDGVFGDVTDPVSVLRDDANGVPMLLDLNNQSDVLPVLRTSGPDQNIWFASLDINTRS
jgi:hypothetical protein